MLMPSYFELLNESQPRTETDLNCECCNDCLYCRNAFYKPKCICSHPILMATPFSDNPSFEDYKVGDLSEQNLNETPFWCPMENGYGI